MKISLNDMIGKSDDFMRDVFRWFGSYLAWIPDDKAKCSRDGRGRNCDPNFAICDLCI